MTILKLIGLVVFVAGCGEGERTMFENEGDVCLRSASDGTLHVTVRFPTCLSSSCHRALATSCTVTETGGEIVIVSSGGSETTGASACTADCRSLSASCDSTVLTPGEYTVVHGEMSQTVTLPQTEINPFSDGSSVWSACGTD